MYQETKFFRETIESLIDISLSRGYSNISFKIGNFEVLVNPLKETTFNKVHETRITLERYGLFDLDNNIKYEILGYRIKDQSFIVVELNKWSRDKNTFLLNDEVNSSKGINILREIRDIVSNLKSQQSDKSPAI